MEKGTAAAITKLTRLPSWMLCDWKKSPATEGRELYVEFMVRRDLLHQGGKDGSQPDTEGEMPEHNVKNIYDFSTL